MRTSTQRDGAPESAMNFQRAGPPPNAETRRASGAQARARNVARLVTERGRMARATAARAIRADTPPRGSVMALRPSPSARGKPRDRGYGTPWTEWPTPLADLHTHVTHPDATWHGNVPAVRAAGLAYHYLIALPVTVVLYAVAWIMQRPARLLATLVIGLLVWAGLTL